MKKRGTTIPQPNYVRKLHSLWRNGVLPRHGVTQVEVLHDDGCALRTQPGRCHGQCEVQGRYTVDGARQHCVRVAWGNAAKRHADVSRCVTFPHVREEGS